MVPMAFISPQVFFEVNVTFKRRLIFIISALLILMLLANFVVSIYNARLYFSDQMSVLSQDASTSLGFAISTAAKEGDMARVNSMMDAVFDSGYYLSADYVSVEGVTVASRSRDIVIENVPEWFILLVDVPTVEGQAEVVSGWFRLGEVHVAAHPGFAYRELWRLFTEQLWLFGFSVVFAYGAVGLLIRALTRPLDRLEAQVQAIAEEDFVEETIIPAAREFRKVVLAVNYMVRKIRASFEQQLRLIETLRKDACMDPLTELPNRSEFDARLAAWLSSEQGGGPCALLLLSVLRLDRLNNESGRESGDRLLEQLADILKSCVLKREEVIVARRSGSDFAVFVPGVFPREVPEFIAQIAENMEDILRDPEYAQIKVALGGAYSISAHSAQQLLQGADESLRQNQSRPEHWGVVSLDATASEYRSAREWLPVLESAVEGDDLHLFYQPAFLNGQDTAHHYEVLCRIKDGERYVDAGVFWPLVERFGLYETVDRVVVGRVLTLLRANTLLRLSLNLSAATVKSDEFRAWLDETLGDEAEEVRQRLIIELPERLFRHVDTVVKPFIFIARKHLVEVAIDRFGLMATSMAYIHELDIDIVKLDRRFVHRVADSSENRFYLQTMIGICESCNVTMICEGVEREEDLDVLKSLNAGGFQGFLLGKPSPQPIPSSV